MLKRILVLFVALMISSLGVAEAQNKKVRKRAGAHVNKGRKYQALGQYAKAIKEYQAAYKLIPHPELLYNFAQAHRLKGERIKALEYYQRYLNILPRGRSAVPARKFVKLLEPVVAAEKAELAKRAAEEARKKKAAEGKLAREERDRKAREEAERKRREAAKKKKTAEPDDDDDDDDDGAVGVSKSSKGGGMKLTGLISAGVGVLAMGLGIKFGLDAKSISNELEEESTSAWTDAELARQDEGKSAQTKMFIFTGLGAVAVVVGGVLYMKGRKQAAASERLTFSPVVTPRRVGFALSRSF